ncbi:MAG: hypothetical protein K2J85_06240 [Anaeroplasmataceae bacterium]|nr:hypothetical protein [Anaeroplasmataceae bacterium]
MKKFLSILVLGLLAGLTSCVYLGLSQKTINKYTKEIVKQVSEIEYKYYHGNLEFRSEEESVSVSFSCIDGFFEFYIHAEDKVFYNVNGEERCFDETTLTEEAYYKDVHSYSYYQNIEELIQFIKDFDGKSDKSMGRIGMDEDAGVVLDEVTHYYYNLDWTFNKEMEINFYVTREEGIIKRISMWDYGKDNLSFSLRLYMNPKAYTDSEFDRMYEDYKKYLMEKEPEEDQGSQTPPADLI